MEEIIFDQWGDEDVNVTATNNDVTLNVWGESTNLDHEEVSKLINALLDWKVTYNIRNNIQ